ncbi:MULTISPECIES: hypothetical protein [Pseudomonas]|uniref:hypothetical protein n=1 Tax=Pseudomonas TaxID=286 RepID=UPI000F01D6E7|nr:MULTISPECIES: hypothetical protein [Pseudomonas]MBD8681219.1 hypothetical protein [Pseudomonas sp. CFBP 13719]
MESGRITFQGNPWPEGHPLSGFTWGASIKDGSVWFDFHLSTKDYDSEREVEQDEEAISSDWEAAVTWKNYRSCTLSSEEWGVGGFKACKKKLFTPDWLDGKEFQVDSCPADNYDQDDLAFSIYLLGHDSTAHHKIKFQRVGSSNLFDIVWTGKIALTYAGDYAFEHDFSALISGVEFPLLN